MSNCMKNITLKKTLVSVVVFLLKTNSRKSNINADEISTSFNSFLMVPQSGVLRVNQIQLSCFQTNYPG